MFLRFLRQLEQAAHEIAAECDHGFVHRTYICHQRSTRSVVVIDPEGKVIYTELVPEITQEPNYEAALKAVK